VNDEVILKPCPFCGWKKIRIMEEKQKKSLLKGCKFTYCWCKVCGTKGPWAYSVDDEMREVVRKCVERWNDRDGVDGISKNHFRAGKEKV